MITLVVIRHGNTFDKGQTLLRVGSRTDLPLSSSGREQAALLGRHLKARFPRPDGVYNGPLRRQRETADLILSAYDAPPRVRAETDALNEADYGQDDGRPEDAVRARVGTEALERWEKDSVPPPGWNVDTEAMDKGWRAFEAYLHEQFLRPGSVIFAVTSNGAARFAPRALLHPDAPLPKDLKLSTAAFGVFKLDAASGARALLEWNTRAPAQET